MLGDDTRILRVRYLDPVTYVPQSKYGYTWTNGANKYCFAEVTYFFLHRNIPYFSLIFSKIIVLQ